MYTSSVLISNIRRGKNSQKRTIIQLSAFRIKRLKLFKFGKKYFYLSSLSPRTLDSSSCKTLWRSSFLISFLDPFHKNGVIHLKHKIKSGEIHVICKELSLFHLLLRCFLQKFLYPSLQKFLWKAAQKQMKQANIIYNSDVNSNLTS